MFDLQQVTALQDSRKWSELARFLAQDLDKASGMVLFRSLVQLSIAHRHLGDIDLARDKMLQALTFAETNPALISPSNWCNLSHQLEAAGMLHEAHRAVSSIDPAQMIPALTEAYGSPKVMIDRLNVAFAIERELASSKVEVVSLGQNCIPDDIVKRWGFGAHYAEGPFSAGVFFGEGVTQAIEEDFAKYLDPSEFKVSNTASGFMSASLPGYHTMFNHEVGEDWIGNDLARLRDLYAHRISTFRSLAEAPGCVYIFVRNSGAELHRLLKAVDRVAPANRRLLVLDFCAAPPAAGSLPHWVSYKEFAMPYDPKNSAWYIPKNFNTDIGFKFESALADSIADEIRRIS